MTFLKRALRNHLSAVRFPGWPRLCRLASGRLPIDPVSHLDAVANPAGGRREWRAVAPATRIDWPRFRPWGPQPPPPFRIPLPSYFPELGLLHGPSLVAMGPDGWLLDELGRWSPRHSWFAWDPARRPQRTFTQPIQRLKGRAALLCSDWAATNYFHFLLDSVGRLGALRAALPSLESIDHFLIPPALSSDAGRLWSLAGIPEEKRILLTPDKAVEADELFASTFPGHACATHPLALAAIRKLVSATGGRQRLFVPRRAQNRLLRNEAELWNALRPLGFRIFDPSAESGQAENFASASLIVGVHGAALANLAFCAPATRVIEILPTDHCFPFFFALAASHGLDYRCVLAPSEQYRPQDDIKASPYSYSVDIGMVLEAIHAAPAENEQAE